MILQLTHFLIPFFVFLFQGTIPALNQQSFVPGPLKVQVSFEVAWKAMHKVIQRRNLKVQHEERARGLLVTEVQEYSSGALVESHINKIGMRPKLIDGDWVQVRYRYRITVELIEEKESLVSIYGYIEALKRNFIGGETWIDILSNGKLEVDLLTDFGQYLFGRSFDLEKPKKKYWEKLPRSVPLKNTPFF